MSAKIEIDGVLFSKKLTHDRDNQGRFISYLVYEPCPNDSVIDQVEQTEQVEPVNIEESVRSLILSFKPTTQSIAPSQTLENDTESIGLPHSKIR